MSTSTSFPAELRLPAPRPKAIDVAAALEQVGGDFEFVMAVMRDEFLAKAPDQIARCAANARLADAHPADATDVEKKEKRDAALKALAFEAHSMKGASATLHADALSKACHRLERTAKGVPLDALEPDVSVNDPGGPVTFEQRTREIADRFAELEEDVADLVAISDVNVAAASEALGSGLGVALARLAGNAAELAASPAAMLATAAMARGAARAEDDENENERLRLLARAVAADADAVGARALRDAASQLDSLVFSSSVSDDPTPTEKKHPLVEENHVRVDLEPRETFGGRDEKMAERLVAACVELRAAAQTVAFDCAAVCSFEETSGFVKRAQEACGVIRDGRDPAFGTDALRRIAGVRLADASARRGEGFFDAAATAAALRRAFATSSTLTSATEKETERETETWERVPPVDFPGAVRALDGDVAFAEKMLRTFLADAETFASKPLDALERLSPPSPSGSRGSVNELNDGGPNKTREQKGRRLSEEHRRDAQRLGETADWLGAPPLRAAIATLLDGDASEHAVRAARRAVRDLRAFADGLESDRVIRGDEKQNAKFAKREKTRSAFSRRDGGSDDGFRRASPPPAGSGSGSGALRLSSSHHLPKKSASTDEVMRSGLYAYSSSSLTNSGGGSADSNEDEDENRRRGSVGSDADQGSGARSSTDSRDERRFGAYRRRHGSWGGSSGRVSADSAGATEGAVTALAALAPRARARGLAALRTPRRRHGALPFDLRRALERADGDWDFAVGCAGRHAALAREQIAVLRAVMFADERSGAENADTNLNTRDDAQIVASAIAQLRSVAEGVSVSHAPRLMNAVEALAAALVSAAAELSSLKEKPRIEPSDESSASSSVQTSVQPEKNAWRRRSLKLLRSLEKRADEYVNAVDAVANTSRAFSPRFVFSDACGGDAALAVEKLRVLVLAARDAHVAAVRAVAAAEASFGAEALGGAFPDEREEENHISVSSHSSSDEGDASQTPAEGLSSRAPRLGGAREKKPLSAREDVLDDVRFDLSGAFGSLEACERIASSLGARPSERAFRGAASRVARIAVDISAAAEISGAKKIAGKARLNDAGSRPFVVPACFLDDEHAQTVAALAALKREVEALAADFHAIAPDAAVPAAVGKGGKKNGGGGFFSRLFGGFDVFGNAPRNRHSGHRGNGVPGNPYRFDSRVDLDFFYRTVPANAARLASRGANGLRQSMSSENAAVGAATALVASYTVARLCGAFFLASAGDA
jgi:HPt (histidine-containing phosphotransfer) domain-containing protein